MILHEWLHSDNLENLHAFRKFINWLSGEFTLYLQDNDPNGLTVFFPNGWFTVKELESIDDDINFKIEVKSKYEKNGTEIFNQIKGVLAHLKMFQNT